MVTSATAFAQNRTETLRKADILYENYKFYEAIEYYELAIEEGSYMKEIVYKLASLYKKLDAPQQAEKWYEEVLKFKTKDYVLAKFEYALVLKQLGKYEKSISNFEEFIKFYRGDDKSEMIKVVDRHIKGCDRAMMSENDSSFEVIKINLSKANSSYTDLSPYFFHDTLYFSNIRTDTALIYEYKEGIKVQMNLQKVGFDLIEDTIIGTVTNYGPKRPTGDKSQFGGAVFAEEGKMMFLTKCITNKKFENHCDIFGSKFIENEWSIPVKLGPTVNSETGISSSTHPCIAPHRKKGRNILYFSSNQTGGIGGYDLWTVDVDKNFVCSRAKNLGKKINSVGDEITPSFSEELNTLFFSSNGLIGFGGFDIFRVKKEGRKFKNPSAMEGPFNTSTDEFFFRNYGPNKYIFISNRQGAKKYHGQYVLDDMFIVRKKTSKKYLLAKVFLKDSILTEIDDIKIQMVSIDGSRTVSSKKNTRVFAGKEYTLSTDLPGFINDSKTILVEAKSADTLLVKLVINKIDRKKEIQLSNIYFAYKSDILKESSKIELNLLYTILINNPYIKIEIRAHTDSKGSALYNINLSQKRAQSVVNYLISKNIANTRIIAKGYGESTPIAPNHNPDGSDNPEGRQLNRRIGFKVVGLVPIESQIKNPITTSQSITPKRYAVPVKIDTAKTPEKTVELAQNSNPILSKPDTLSSTPKTYDSDHSQIKINIDSTAILADAESSSIEESDQDSSQANNFISDPSIIKNKGIWIIQPTAQRITCASMIEISSMQVMAKEKTGVSFKVRVVNASNGKLISESEEFILKPNKKVSATLTKLMEIEVDFKLKKGSYFIFPVMTIGSLAHIPMFFMENSFKKGAVVLHQSTYTSDNKNPAKYKFSIKKNTGTNYGPFLKITGQILLD
jgi:outer membrane protein OmpA-like peptidoglycan-associated protein